MNPIDEHLFARFAASSPINACDQESSRYANVLNSGNEAIDKTNMRGQQTKIHYLAISKHAPSSRAKISSKHKEKQQKVKVARLRI